MANLTSKELSALEDQLNMEDMLVKKYRNMAASCSDPTIKSKCEQVASKHQEHFSRLLNYLS